MKFNQWLYKNSHFAYMLWCDVRMTYHINKGQTEKARQIIREDIDFD